MLPGVYAIYIVGTPYVYIGESRDIEQRWARHKRSRKTVGQLLRWRDRRAEQQRSTS